jgi:hypothetical protein
MKMNTGYRAESLISQETKRLRTFCFETGVCKVLWLCLGLADLEFGFLQELGCHIFEISNDSILLGSPFASPSFAWRWNP